MAGQGTEASNSEGTASIRIESHRPGVAANALVAVKIRAAKATDIPTVRKLHSTFAITFALCFPAAFILTRYLQDTHRLDSTGLAYTMLVAAVLSAIAGGIAALISFLLARRRVGIR